MTRAVIVPEPRRFLADGKEYLEIRYRELRRPDQFLGLMGFYVGDDGGLDLDSLAYTLAFNNGKRSDVFGTHLILEEQAESLKVIALVSIYPASNIYACSQVKQTYGIESVGMITVESNEEDEDYVAYLHVGLCHAMQCIQKLANRRRTPQTWIALLNPNVDHQKYMESEGWKLRGQRIFSMTTGGNRICSVWHITIRPARLPVITEEPELVLTTS